MCRGLLFKGFTDCRALNNLQKTDLSTIASSRTLRSMETILSNNIEVKHIKGCENGMEDCLL